MNVSVIVGIIILGLVAFGGYTLLAPNDDAMMDNKMMEGDAMEKENDAMMEKEGDAMMEKEGDAMMDTGDSMREGDDAMKKEEGAMMEGDAMTKHGGTYEAYAPEKLAYADSGKVVLFFRASWCPTCKGLDENIRANLQSIPDNVTILDVNYDTATALKQKYGVTYQHTLVQVNADGSQVAKWSGSSSLAQLLTQVK